MADPHADLSVLVDPPLAEPPPVAELQRRAKALRRRTAATRGGLAAAVAVVLIGTGIALVPDDEPQTVQTAAPPSSAAPALAAPTSTETVTTAISTFEVDGQEWKMLATRTADPAICFTLQPATGEALKPGCLTPDGRTLQAAAADLRSVSFVYGIVAPDVTVVGLTADGNSSRLDVLGSGAGFPVNFLGTVIAPPVKAVELTTTHAGVEERVPVAMPVHQRTATVNGSESPRSSPSTSVTTPRPTPTQPPTTLAPDTPVGTVVPPTTPSTTTPPSGGQPKRVQPVPGATDLRRHPFESTAPAGAQSLAVRFWNGVEPCYVLGRVDVTETADKVTITLWTGLGPGAAGMACIQMAGYYEVVVQLQAPLGTRTVVDGAA
jgi:hypothetical protein